MRCIRYGGEPVFEDGPSVDGDQPAGQPSATSVDASGTMTGQNLQEETPFTYRTSRDDAVTIFWSDRPVTTLRGKAAARFLSRVETLETEGAQLEMARVTGNFKRGNERAAKSRERDKA
jgi:hypothetical protein